jgi:hypothetical protein
MAEKVSVKTVVVFSLFCGIVLILGACMNPVDFEAFMEDGAVQAIIEANNKKVIIDPTSDNATSLIAGDKRISGLDPNKYYMIETEKEEDGTAVTGGPWFITDAGLKHIDLFMIKRVSGRSIVGLKNDYTYKVREASFFTSGTSFNYNDGTGKTANVDASGAITITTSATTISLGSLSTTYDGYEVMAVAVTANLTFSNFTDKIKIGMGMEEVSSFNLEGAGTSGTTMVDYVFYKAGTTAIFKVLRVIITPIPTTNVNITISFTINEKTTGNNTSIAIKELEPPYNTATLTLTVTGGDTANNINWYHNGNQLAGETLQTLNLSSNPTPTIPPYMVVGTHIFTATCDIKGVPYSANFTLTVTEN